MAIDPVTGNPFFYGEVLTVAQWTANFAKKQDALGYTPVNKAGDTMLGRLRTTPSSSALAGFNIQPGTAPASPNDGDVWVTAVGIFARVNGVTIGPLGATATPILTKSANYTVTSADLAAGKLNLEVNADGGAFTIIVPPALGASATSPLLTLVSVGLTGAPNFIQLSDGTNIVDSIITPATAVGQIGGWRDVYSNGTTLRSFGVG